MCAVASWRTIRADTRNILLILRTGPRMTTSPSDLGRRLTTPRAAAVAGVLFAALLGTSTVLLRMSVPPVDADSVDWIASNEYRVDLASWSATGSATAKTGSSHA